MKRILVAGSLVLDILPVFAPYIKAENLIEEGKVVECQGVQMYLGGEVGNSGLALKRLGMEVLLVSKIGDDSIGCTIRELLGREKTDMELKVLPGMPSTVSVAIALEGRDKSTIHGRGASQTFLSSDIQEWMLEKTEWFHFGYPTSMDSLFCNQGEELVKLVRKVKDAGVGVSLDMSLPDLKTRAGQVDWREILPQVLPYIDIFMPSAEETMFLLNKEEYQKKKQELQGKDFMDFLDEAQVRMMAEILLRWGSKAVLLKCGKKGMYFRSSSEFKGRREITQGFCEKKVTQEKTRITQPDEWSRRELWCAPYKPKKILSTTGAGDIAIAGFLCGYLNGLLPDSALSLAAYASKTCLESYDTISGLESFECMVRRMRMAEKVRNGLDNTYWREDEARNCYLGQNDIERMSQQP